jgi:hypothetical protein
MIPMLAALLNQLIVMAVNVGSLRVETVPSSLASNSRQIA